MEIWLLISDIMNEKLNTKKKDVIYVHNIINPSKTQFRRLVMGFPQRRSGFDLMLGHVGFVVDNVLLGGVFSEYFGFPY
jgi:hypothetical protein